MPGAPWNQDQKVLSLKESIASPFPCALVRVALSREGWWPEERLQSQSCVRDSSPQDGSLCRQVRQAWHVTTDAETPCGDRWHFV